MIELETIRALEQEFWTAGGDFYRERLAGDCRMALPGVGFLSRPEVVHAIEAGPRWTSVRMSEEQVTGVEGDTLVFSYRAMAEREGESEPYEALVSSCYTREGDEWRLSFHQQTPVG